MDMFIKTVTKRNRYSPKLFKYQYLVESIRTHKGPRHRFLLNPGKLALPEDQWSLLAGRIQEIIRGQKTLFRENPEIERLATQYAQELLRKSEAECGETEGGCYQPVDLDSIGTSRVRTVGAEHVSLAYFRRLGLDTLLSECGFSKRAVQVATLLVISRLVRPGSERHTHRWAQNISALDELLDTDFGHLSLNTLYTVSKKILKAKERIESHLRIRERDLFGLDENIVLYDLTNTFLEGRAAGNPKAKFGRSKEKRSDCRLLTLGLVVDGHG
ncbi:transposase, partial [bacterium]|nr:transposase [bacterium]